MIFGNKDHISVSRHSVDRFREHCVDLADGLTSIQIVDLIRVSVVSSGPFGGQLGDDLLMKPTAKGMDHIVFAVHDTKERSRAGGKQWAVKTVLLEDEAMANIETFCPQRRG